jgi:hypothetical protein
MAIDLVSDASAARCDDRSQFGDVDSYRFQRADASIEVIHGSRAREVIAADLRQVTVAALQRASPGHVGWPQRGRRDFHDLDELALHDGLVRGYVDRRQLSGIPIELLVVLRQVDRRTLIRPLSLSSNTSEVLNRNTPFRRCAHRGSPLRPTTT